MCGRQALIFIGKRSPEFSLTKTFRQEQTVKKDENESDEEILEVLVPGEAWAMSVENNTKFDVYVFDMNNDKQAVLFVNLQPVEKTINC